MIIINPLLAVMALIPAPFVVWTASRYNRISRPAVQEVAQRVAELTAEAEENVSGIRIVKAFAREEFQLHRFQRAVKRVFDQSIYSTRLQAFFCPLIGLLPQLGIALVLLIGGRMVIDGNLSLGNFTAFYIYLVMLAGPLRMLGVAMGMAQRAVASGNRMFEIIDREPAIQSPADPVALPAGGGRVELRDVTLRYAAAPGSEHEAVPALHDVSLEVEAGKTVALVGPSGSGKTSLVALIARLYDPSEGAVLVDGVDVRDVDARAAALARSPSSPTTASSSPPASPTTSPTRAARRAARRSKRRRASPRPTASSSELPDGYDTRVGERGLTLSGGQRQRVAIARALLADPRDPDPRRRHLLGRRDDRGGDQSGAARGDGRADDVHHRPPPLDRLAGRRDHRPRPRRGSSTAAPTRS